MFAADHAGVSPDVMCVGKALTGGYVTMAAALCTSEVARGISGGSGDGAGRARGPGVLMHGPTFMGNPLASAVARASIELLRERDWRAEVTGIEAALRSGLAPARDLPGVVDVRVLGAIGVVQLDHEVDMGAATAAALDAGVWLRPFRDLVYTMPPYVCTAEDLAAITEGVQAVAAAA
jgi:adenosylmethionine-8-amino-7-oxononanoate aminotransferase